MQLSCEIRQVRRAGDIKSKSGPVVMLLMMMRKGDSSDIALLSERDEMLINEPLYISHCVD